MGGEGSSGRSIAGGLQEGAGLQGMEALLGCSLGEAAGSVGTWGLPCSCLQAGEGLTPLGDESDAC